MSDIQFAFATPEAEKDLFEEIKYQEKQIGFLAFIIGGFARGDVFGSAELILQTLIQNPEARILLTSQTHVALDNALERLTKVDNTLKIVRIASDNTVKSVADSTAQYLLSHQMQDWKEEVLEKGKSFLRSWAAENNVAASTHEMGTFIKELLILKKRLIVDNDALANLEKELHEMESDQIQTTREIKEEDAAEYKTEIRSIRKKIKDTENSLRDLQDKLVKLDEDASEFLTWSLKEIEVWAKENYYPSTIEDKNS